MRRYLPVALIGVLILCRLADFWGLHYASTDDIALDSMRMTMPLDALVQNLAASQSRVQFYVAAPVWVAVMSLSGTPWYDLINLGSFALSVLLPVCALRRYILPRGEFLLYALAVFATLPLLFGYGPPYCYPLLISFPLTACGSAILIFQRARTWGGLAAGGVATFFAIYAYEAAMVLSILVLATYFCFSSEGKPWNWILARRDLRCAALVFASVAMVYVSFRMAHPAAYGGVKASTAFLSLPAIVRVVGTLSLTSSIYAWFGMPQWAHHIHPDIGAVPVWASVSWAKATVYEIVLAGMTAGLAGWLILRPQSSGKQGRPLRLAGVGLLLLVAPNVAYPLTEKISSLVMSGKLYAYTPTPFSQAGVGCLFAALALAAGRIRSVPPRVVAASVLAGVLGCGSLAASVFNRESGVFAREQASRWKVMGVLAGCSARIPAEYRQGIVAPELWNDATAALGWEDDFQAKLYWDAVAYDHYGMRVHMMPKAERLPVTWLDFRLEKDGELASVVVSRSTDGKTVQESWACSGGAAQPGPVPQVTPAVGETVEVVSPSRGEGMERTFRVTVAKQFRGEDAGTVGLLINGIKQGVDGCYVVWDYGKKQEVLVNNNGEGSRPFGPAGSVENRQCELLASGSVYELDGQAITVTFHVKFRDGFRGLKQMYLFREDDRREKFDLRPVGWWWVRPSR